MLRAPSTELQLMGEGGEKRGARLTLRCPTITGLCVHLSVCPLAGTVRRIRVDERQRVNREKDLICQVVPG